MIRVGFIIYFDQNWLGGFNYLKNLFFAIGQLPDQPIKPVVFFGNKADPQMVKSFAELAEIQQLSIFDRFSPAFLFWKFSKLIFSSDRPIDRIAKRFNIDVFSHSMVSRLKNVATIGWIPDFQHLYLRDNFSANEKDKRDRLFREMALRNDLIVLSSKNAYQDFCKFAPESASKGRILNFVAQPNRKLFTLTKKEEDLVLEKYGITNSFFFLPNQFWKHKNHQVVLDAMALLEHKGCKINLVCSGAQEDYRSNSHVQKLQSFITNKKLNVQILGKIPYEDVIVLMRRSQAVINPSKFEGWSSTVEECKAISQPMILSNIPVHREQNHPNCIYFEPDDTKELAELLYQALSTPDFLQKTKIPDTSEILLKLEEQTLSFAKNYLAIVNEALKYRTP